MPDEVRLNRIREWLEPLEYPLSKADARERAADITIRYADGEEPLADVIARSNADPFESVEDLESEIYSNLPVEAVGEPGQSEGEG